MRDRDCERCGQLPESRRLDTNGKVRPGHRITCRRCKKKLWVGLSRYVQVPQL